MVEVAPEPEPEPEPEVELAPEPEPEPEPEATFDEAAAILESLSAASPEEPTTDEVASDASAEEPEPTEDLTPEEYAFGALSMAELADIPAPPISEELPPDEPAVEGADESAPGPSGDFEADLRALGLGELPGEEAPAEPEPDVLTEFEVPETPPTTEPVVEEPEPEADLDQILRSLGTEAEAGEAEVPGQVISTDAYLAEFDTDVGLQSGLGDEITALTGGGGGGGGGRQRPSATVSKLPEPGEGAVLHRDQRVDRGLLMKIIEGIEKL